MSQSSQKAFDEQHTILKIKQYDDEINRLEKQLRIQQRERSQLKTQLDLYRASIAPIKRLSEDVLFLIFSEMIAEFPRTVGPLLLVCRAWYQLVTNRPTLWSNIESRPEEDMNRVEWLTSYVNSAVRYSANMPLDIHLNLWSIAAPCVWAHIFTALEKVRKTRIRNNDGDSLYHRTQHWAKVERGAPTFPLVVDYARILELHLESLTGKKGEVASRWRSLKIVFEPELFATVGLPSPTFLHHPTPLLEKLVIELPRSSAPLYLTTFLPITPRLKSVRWDSNPNINLATLISCKSQVTNLQICYIVPDKNLSYTMLFDNIQRLSLDFGTPHDRRVVPWVSNSDTAPLAYPQLEDLTFFGNIPRFIADGLDAPKLHTLRLLCRESVPTLLDSSFRGPHLRTLFLDARVPDIVGVSKKFMARFKGIREFALVHYWYKAVEDGLREMKRNGFPATRGYCLLFRRQDMDDPTREVFID